MKFFWTVLRSYTRTEKIVSALLLVFLIVAIRGIIETPWEAKKVAYTEGLLGEILNINPLFTDFNPVDRDLVSLIFSGLVRYNPKTKEFVPDLAVFAVGEQGRKYTFVLQEGVKFHDGQPVTAEDVLFTYKTVIQHPDFTNRILKGNFAGATIEKKDDRTVEITLERPNAFFLETVTVGILPKHILGQAPIAALRGHEFNRKPVGSGPYMMREPYQMFENGRTTATLEAYPEYWGEKPNIQKIRIITAQTVEKLFEEESGFLGMPKLKMSEWKTLQQKTPRFRLLTYTLPQYTAIFINTDRIPDVNMRRALSLALNRKAIAEAVGHFPLMTPFTENDVPDHDVMEARKLVQKKEPEAFNVELLVRQPIPEEEETIKILMKMLQEQWRELGITLRITIVPIPMFQERIKSRDFDLLLFGQRLGYSPDIFSFFHSSQVGEQGLNLSNWRSFEADTTIEAIRVTTDTDSREEHKHRFAALVKEQFPVLFLYTPVYAFALDARVHGATTDNLAFHSDRFLTIGKWTIDE